MTWLTVQIKEEHASLVNDFQMNDFLRCCFVCVNIFSTRRCCCYFALFAFSNQLGSMITVIWWIRRCLTSRPSARAHVSYLLLALHWKEECLNKMMRLMMINDGWKTSTDKNSSDISTCACMSSMTFLKKDRNRLICTKFDHLFSEGTTAFRLHKNDNNNNTKTNAIVYDSRDNNAFDLRYTHTYMYMYSYMYE